MVKLGALIKLPDKGPAALFDIDIRLSRCIIDIDRAYTAHGIHRTGRHTRTHARIYTHTHTRTRTRNPWESQLNWSDYPLVQRDSDQHFVMHLRND